jgi:hypothetical protein
MAILDSILNTLIPILVVVGGIFLFYRAAQKPIDQLIALIKRGISGIRSKVNRENELDLSVYPTIQYE